MPPEAPTVFETETAMEATDLELGQETAAATPTPAGTGVGSGEFAPEDGNGIGNNNATTISSKNGGKHLRWTRIAKSVEIKDTNAGLLRGSIAGKVELEMTDKASPTPTDDDDEEQQATATATGASPSLSTSLRVASAPSSSKNKTILNGVSGSASPGQVLALMGPSGSGKNV